jgi:hypothetical protein
MLFRLNKTRKDYFILGIFACIRQQVTVKGRNTWGIHKRKTIIPDITLKGYLGAFTFIPKLLQHEIKYGVRT